MAGAVGIALNLLLAVGKFIVGVLSGALSVQADAVNNLSDAGSQIISLVSFRIAARPADREHPFGHARIEYVASMIVSFAILLVGWELLTGSVRKILHPEPTAFRWLSVIVLGVSALVKLWMFFFNRSIARRIGSSVMRATAADSLSDAGATCAVLVCMLILRFTGVDVDAYAALPLHCSFSGAASASCGTRRTPSSAVARRRRPCGTSGTLSGSTPTRWGCTICWFTTTVPGTWSPPCTSKWTGGRTCSRHTT